MISSLPLSRTSTNTHPLQGQTMKELLQQMAAYNCWANQKILEVILALPEEKQQQVVPSSFKSILATVLHIWNAESIWWQRLKLFERILPPADTFNGTMQDAANALMQQDQLWLDWVGNASEIALEHVMQYQNSKKEQFKQPVYQVALHVFNHSTYHRGQLVNMLRQVGIEKIPQTDYIAWSRKK